MQADNSKDQASEAADNVAAKPPDSSPADAGTVPGGGAAGPSATPQSSLILLVDDDAELGDKLRTHFEAKGVRVQTFISRVDVLEWSWQEKPVLFVVDQNLGGEDGRSLALDLRDHGKLGDCPMVLTTESDMDRPNREFTLKLGFRKIISKPFGFDVLERVIADEPRVRAEALRGEAADKQVDEKLFQERKAAVLKKMGLGEEPETGGKGAAEQAPGAPGHGIPTTKKVQITASMVPKAKTAAVGVAAGPRTTAATAQHGAAPEEELPGTAIHWLKGLLLGLLFPAVLLGLRVFLVSSGYATLLVSLEGVVLGLLLGLGLCIGLKRLPAPPDLVPVAVSALFLTLAVWGLSLYLRHAMNIEFVEYSQAARAHLKDPGRSWGVSEWMAVAYNLAGGMLTFAFAMCAIRSFYMKLERAARSGKRV